MYKGAIIGFGQVAEQGHVPAFRAKAAHFEIAAVADASPERRDAAKKYYPAARTYESIEDLISHEPELDFADIASPPVCHFSQSMYALKKGLHVLCEKPLVFKPAEFKKLQGMARKRNKCLFTVHNWKKALPIVKARELIDAGLIGDVAHLELHVLRAKAAATAQTGNSNWRQNPALSGGGIMADHGWHNFYLAHYLAGAMPSKITVSLDYPEGVAQEAENAAACWIDLGKKTALIYLTWKSPVRKNYGVVYGDKGIIELRDSAVVLETGNGAPQVFETGDKLSAGSAHPEWMAALLDDFRSEMDGNGRGANLIEAQVCVALLANGYKSARSQKSVKITQSKSFASIGE